MKEFLNYVVLPIIVVIEVTGIAELYPVCKDSIWKLVILYAGVYFVHEIYRAIKNYYFNY